MRCCLFTCVALASAAPFRDWANYSFDSYCQDFDKAYNSMEEKGLRQELFAAELLQVLAQNREYLAGRSSWYAAVNDFSDWTVEEFGRLTKGRHSGNVDVDQRVARLSSDAGNPTKFDWREKGVATPVKNQGGCGSCWAFGSTEVLESFYAIASGNLVELAPQAYVNCAPNPDDCGGTGGCEGSIPELAFNWSATAGMPLETDLPYTARDGACTAYKATVVNSGYVKLPANDAVGLETAIATIGPMAVNVAASPWSRYGGGIFSGGCSAQSCTLNHIVAAYGYDTEGEGYWLARNSWGANWGEDGYIRLSRANDDKTYIDTNPGAGVACKPFPETQSVMGESGVLFDISYPTDVRTAAASVSI